MQNGVSADQLAFYEHCGREIAFKSRQWHAVFYSLLGNAALVVIRHHIVPDVSAWTIGLVVVAASVAGFTINLLARCDQDRSQNRTRMLASHPRFDEELRKVAGPSVSDTDTPVALYAVVGGGFFLTFLLLLASPGAC